MILPHNCIANLRLTEAALDEFIAFPIERQGDERIVEMVARLRRLSESPPTEHEMFLAVMLALAIERLRVQEGFAA
jgi:hypothetical protein